jgi:transposase
VPAEFGPWQTLCKRHRRWSTDGTYQRIFERVLELQDQAGKLNWPLSVDTTIARAHQHPAGAPKPHTGGPVELTRFPNPLITDSVVPGVV